MTENGKTTYLEALLERGHNFGLHVRNGWVFGRILDYEPTVQIPYNRYDGLTKESSNATIGGGTSGTYWWKWEDANKKDILYERDGEILLQAFVGVGPKRLRKWMQFPEAQIRGNLDQITVPAAPSSSTGGFLDGLASPYHMPTVLSELLIPKEVNVYHAVYNPELFTVQPLFNLFIRRHRVKWLDPGDMKDRDYLSGIIGRIEGVRSGPPAHLWSPGLNPWNYDSDGKLGVMPVKELTLDSLMGVKA